MPTDRIPEILSTTENTNVYICLVFTTPVPRDHYGYTMVHTEGATNMMKTDNVDGSCPHMPTRCVDANVHTDNVDGSCPHIARQSVYTEGNTLSTDATMKCGFQVHRQRMHCVGLGETLAFVRIAYTTPSSAHLYQWMGSTRADDIDYTYSPTRPVSLGHGEDGQPRTNTSTWLAGQALAILCNMHILKPSEI